ncbi:MAG: hypothetical protein EHM33_00905 [Chloroflexi bacterium]|nr:MAG: hypothetical protein EHM33_00905 [Chloroflexota bacterium]
MRTTGAAGETYTVEAAIRRIEAGAEDLGASHTYDYNTSGNITIPAGPPNAGIPMSFVILFTSGADMDNLANNDFFVLRVRRGTTGTATDALRMITSLGIVANGVPA